jgi:hypothetical protein
MVETLFEGDESATVRAAIVRCEPCVGPYDHRHEVEVSWTPHGAVRRLEVEFKVLRA